MRFSRLRLYAALATGCFSAVSPLAAQQLPSNSTIQGSFYFRYLGVDTTTTNFAMSALGTLTFDGNGKYTISGTELTSNGSGTNTTKSLTTSGTYQVLSNGMFYMDGFATANPVYGGVASGPILVGSSTDSPDLDTFVAIPVANNNASNATLSGNYNVASLEFQNGDFTLTRDTFFSMTANGSGSLGNPSVSGYANNVGTTAVSQSISGATYTVGTAGNGTMTLPAPSGVAAASQLLTGAKTLYVTPDGSFFIAGSASSYDMIVGVKALTGSTNTTPLSGLYFTAIVEDDLTSGGFGLYSSYGVGNESSGTELAYERSTDPVDGSYDSTYDDTFAFQGNGTFSGPYSQYAAGAGGNIAIGSGASGLYFLNIYAKASALSGSGVFLNPQAIVNTASYAPFEASITPGEFITLFGSGLSTQTATATSLPFPTTLGNVQVTIDGTAIPLYVVSPGAIAGIVPYTSRTDGNLVTIQVVSNGTKSNAAQMYSGTTAPGVFTLTQNGVGDGAILDAATYAPITTSNPAKIGEQIALFLSGLGPVNSTVAAGAAGPSSPLAYLVNPLLGVYIDGVSATINYQGLAPGLAGLYQLNVTIPAGVTTGTSVNLEIDTVDAYNSQATIPISK
jgi:uncharacterized protein (TIGR03437 family)